MEEHKELESLVEKFFEADSEESPSMGFTNQVIAQIEALENAKFKYRPLLPKWVLVLVGILTSIFVWYAITFNKSATSESDYLSAINMDAFFANLIGQFDFSGILGYSLLAFGIMICAQTVVLTKYLNKRFA